MPRCVAELAGSWGYMHAGVAVVLLVAALLLVLRLARPERSGADRDRADSLAILKTRFARGEVSREEFLKMREILDS